MTNRDGHVRVLPLHVANKIAAGEVVERPASVVKEIVENAIDAGARRISISIADGGRKAIEVKDDGCGMTKEDALLSLERQATSKISDVDDIENIDTLGFRGEAIPSIASVSRFSITTRRHDCDEGCSIEVTAGNVTNIGSAGCPPGTIVEVRDIFCNVPARRKFLRSAATEENHIRAAFTTFAIAHPEIGFTLIVDGREVHRLAPAASPRERVSEIFGREFIDSMVDVQPGSAGPVEVRGLIEKPNLLTPTRREQYIFINGRSASAPIIAHALREACPRRQGDVRPAAVIFIKVPAKDVDVNVHPAKREVRFRNPAAVKTAIIEAIGKSLCPTSVQPAEPAEEVSFQEKISILKPEAKPAEPPAAIQAPAPIPPPEEPKPQQLEFAVDENSTSARPWRYFRFLAQSESGYLLIETDAGIVTINPIAARERIAFERLMHRGGTGKIASQTLLIPKTLQFSPVEFARIKSSLEAIRGMGFQIEEFGAATFKIEAVPQLIESLSPASILSTIARDLAEGRTRKSGEKWREEIIARSIARSFAGASIKLDEKGGTRLVEELSSCRMPYVCPRGKPVMIFTSNSELNRKFNLA